MKIKKLMQASATAGMLSIATISSAATVGGVELNGSGFMTVAVGKMLGGTSANVMDYNCPCFISDYAQAGIYDNSNGLQWKPDSKLGLQGTASFAERRFSVTAQAVSRGAKDGAVNLEWLYASMKVNDKITIQAGRKRLPMFYYSDVQDVGVALPWTHLPPGPYGWEAVNYNGINLAYQDQFGNWTAAANILAGSESNNDTGYYKVYGYGRQSRSNIKWDNIVGGNLTLSKDWLETRLVYIQSNTEENNVSGGWNGQNYGGTPGVINPRAQQKIYGLTVNADYNNWLVRTEFLSIDHPGLGFKDYAQLIGLGYQYGKWLPMITGSEYVGTTVNDGLVTGANPFPENMQQTVSLSVRYDLTTSSDLKVQYDSQTDHSSPAYTGVNYNYGDSQLLTLAYDTTF